MYKITLYWFQDSETIGCFVYFEIIYNRNTALLKNKCIAYNLFALLKQLLIDFSLLDEWASYRLPVEYIMIFFLAVLE